MNCIILLLLLCCQGNCGNGAWSSSNGNCDCENEHCHHHHHVSHNNYSRERNAYTRDVESREDSCDCMDREDYDAARMAPPSWQEFPGLTSDCDCND